MTYRHQKIRTLWGLCVLGLIAIGCSDEGVSKFVEGNSSHISVQESKSLESASSEFRSNPVQSNDADQSKLDPLDQANVVTQQVGDSVSEESAEQNQRIPAHSEKLELESMEQRATDSAFEPIAPDASKPYHSAQVASDISEDRETPGLEDRTQDKVVKLVVDSITLKDCVMRGEVQNSSDDHYARNVTVMIGSHDGEDSVQWHWPLTMLPGESAPFEVQIGWFPHTYNSANYGDMQYALNIENWNYFANTYLDVVAELSLTPDLKRSFQLNADGTEFLVMYQNPGHRFLVYDERALELESSKRWYRHGREQSVISALSFASALPGDFVLSNDIDPIVSEFTLYKYTDLFYVPSRLYPDIYQAGVDDSVTNVKAYQAYKRGPRMIDVRELVPHSIPEEADAQGLLLDRELIPKTDFVNYDRSDGEQAYLQLLAPHYFFEELPTRNVAGESSTHREPSVGYYISDDVWIGGVSHREVSSTGYSWPTLVDENRGSCYASGPLCVGDFILQGQMATHFTDVLGRQGPCPSFEANVSISSDSGISVDQNSITLHGQEIRGLIHNPSRNLLARDVAVIAKLGDSEIQLGEWRWPLSVQPGEHAPFEISHHLSNLRSEDIQFQVSAKLSEDLDPTRSFLLNTFAGGRVYGAEFRHLYDDMPFASPHPMYYEIKPRQVLDYHVIQLTPGIRYTKNEFLELYGGAVRLEDIKGVELFSFKDIYARLEAPDSHPELAKIATTQHIHDLRAYAARFDEDMRVVDVEEISLFTPIYGVSNLDQQYVEVDAIPAPNRWSPNAVRLLLITPYEDEEDMNRGRYSQVWIGGASESVG